LHVVVVSILCPFTYPNSVSHYLKPWNYMPWYYYQWRTLL
jgi:hypothetical protein